MVKEQKKRRLKELELQAHREKDMLVPVG